MENIAYPNFNRKTVLLEHSGKTQTSEHLEPKVLVLNASKEMAKEITFELSSSMPHCSIMYAPTIDVAALLLKRHDIQLVISSPLLPDGNITRLCETLSQLKNQPAVVVVGKMTLKNAEEIERSQYALSYARVSDRSPKPLDITIRSLGAEIRDRLNNPLQEIVAMAFVAKSGAPPSPAVEKALEAISSAAKNMSVLVNNIEQNIRHAIEPIKQ
jgi:signal transduction histidine kinase